jgi:hypothetical protein
MTYVSITIERVFVIRRCLGYRIDREFSIALSRAVDIYFLEQVLLVALPVSIN